jgi:3-hydroxy-9,10-secoandrosta-1,3,5(10)-triene-9,17-dione monooxygenase
MARAAALAPLLQSAAPQAEAAGDLSDASIRAIADAGLFRLMVSRRLGGHQLDLRAYVEVVAEMARGDGAAGWLAFILNANDWIVAAVFPERVQQAIYGADPDVRIAGVFEGAARIDPAEGGWRVSGRFAYSSGCRHAAWGLFGVPLLGADGAVRDQAMVLIPTAQMTREESWQVTGMRATGSNTLVADDLFVPADYVTTFSQAAHGAPGARPDESEYFTAFVPTVVLILVPALLGMARAALDHTIARLGQGKRVAYTFYGDSREAPATQIRLAQAATLVDSAFLHVRHWADRLCQLAEARQDMALLERTQVRMASAHAAQCCKDALEILLDIQASGAFALANPIERIARDLAMASRHGLMNLAMVQEAYGRVLLGVEARNTPLL